MHSPAILPLTPSGAAVIEPRSISPAGASLPSQGLSVASPVSSWANGRLQDTRRSARLRFAYGDPDYYRETLARRESVPNVAREFTNLNSLQDASRESQDALAFYEAVIPARDEYFGALKASAGAALMGAIAILPATWLKSGGVDLIAAALGFSAAAGIGMTSVSGRSARDGLGIEAARRVFGGVASLTAAGIAAGGLFLYGPSGDAVGIASAAVAAVGAGLFLNLVPTALARGLSGAFRHLEARARVPQLESAFSSLSPMLGEKDLRPWFDAHPEDELAVVTDVWNRLFEEAGRWEIAWAQNETAISEAHAKNEALKRAGLPDEDYRREYAGLEKRYDALKLRRAECAAMIADFEVALAEVLSEKEALEARVLLKRSQAS